MLIVLIVSSASCTVSVNSNKTNILDKMVLSGITPKEASCAVAVADGGTTEAVRLYCLSK